MGFNLTMVLLFLFFLISIASVDGSTKAFNVKEYGAVADGKTDSSKAFETTWNEACTAVETAHVLIPDGSYLVGPLTFSGPCQGAMTVQLKGHLVAIADSSVYPNDWINFRHIDRLTISGGGQIDGRGASAWPLNQCPKSKKCHLFPTSLLLRAVSNATISDISFIDSKQFHIKISSSNNIVIDSINITAPDYSTNTDGIHVQGSSKIYIANSIIGTGDDCVSIGPSNTNIFVSNVLCGPGHGISVGSLGQSANEGDVVGLTVRNCTLTGTTNGVRIKTWPSSPITTSAYDFIYENIVMNNVRNPIIIDQKYCPYQSCPENDPSRVKISNVTFRNISGTSASPVAINMVCSDRFPCQNVQLGDINLEYEGKKGVNATAICINVKGNSNDNVKPNSCI